MASGTLYTYADNFRANKALIAAAYSGANVKLADFEFGVTNKSTEFLQKFPLGKVPAFESSNGLNLYESNAIAQYVSNEALTGKCPDSAALVRQFVEFADNEVLPAACVWVFPTLGLRQYNKGDTAKAMEHIQKCLTILNNILSTKTFLVGERVTLADITLCCNMMMLYKQVLDPKFRSPYGNVTRWFLTCVNQPEFKKVIGDFKLCEQMAQFDSAKFAQLKPKQATETKKKEKKPKAESKPKSEPKQEKKDEAKDEEAAPRPSKKCPFAHLPPSTFVMDSWKKIYSNEDTEKVAIPWFYENIDKEGYSQWYMERKPEYQDTLDENLKFQTINLVGGFIQRLGKLAKNGFGSILVFGENKNNTIAGVWLFRGQELAFELDEDWNIDAPSFNFRKLDYNNEEDQTLWKRYLAWDPTLTKNNLKFDDDGKIFK